METARLTQWNDMAGDAFGDIAIDARAPGFRASLRSRSWGTLAISDIHSTPARVAGGARSQASEARGCFLLLNVLGRTCVSQDGHATVLGPAELTVVRRGAPYRIEFERDHRMQVLAVPELDERSAIDEHVARCHPCREVPLLGAFMARLAEMDDALTASLDGDATPRLALDLLALSWPRRGASPAGEPRAPAAWERRLLACVERELCDPELDAAILGRHLGVSARYVQMIFARLGTAASACIQERRPQRVARRLRADSAARIGEVAFETGFNDLSHFCRCFRRRFGCSARDWRGRY